MLTIAPTTFDTVSLAHQTGKRFLRRILRDNKKFSYTDSWKAHASVATGWCLEFSRTVSPRTVGDQEQTITVRTDIEVAMKGKTGQVRSFHDSAEVYIPEPSRLWASCSTVSTLAQLILNGCRLVIRCSGGSSNSSRHGLAFYDLVAEKPSDDFGVTIDSTLLKDGRVIICGSVE